MSTVLVKRGATSRATIGPKAVIKANYTVIRMVRHGFSTQAIAQHVGMSLSQVQYRVRMYGLQWQRSAFRHNLTRDSAKMLKFALRASSAERKADTLKADLIRQQVLGRMAARSKTA